MEITFCPTCGSKKISKLTRNWTGNHKGEVYVVPKLTYFECSSCGERLYDKEAMRKIEAYSPAFAKQRPLRKSA